MKLLQCVLTANRCHKTGAKIKPKGVMVHSTGAANPMLRRYVQPVASTPGRAELLAQLGRNKNGNDWNREGQWVRGEWVPLNACVHGFIGKLADGSVAAVQTLPWNHRGWHAGTGTSGRSANDTHISFEICEDGLTDPNYFRLVYREAVELTAMLCREYGLDPLADGVVICHSEGYRRGIASGHADVEHWFPRHGKSMDDFRRDVAVALAPKPEPDPDPDPKPDPEEDDEMTYYKTLDEVPEWYRPTVEKLVEAGALKGTGADALNVSEDFCRTMTVLDRLGKLD